VTWTRVFEQEIVAPDAGAEIEAEGGVVSGLTTVTFTLAAVPT
jgi:hypothetical protein